MKIAFAATILVALTSACGTTPEERARHDQMMLERCAELRREVTEAKDDVSRAYARNNYESTCLGKREHQLPDDAVPTRN